MYTGTPSRTNLSVCGICARKPRTSGPSLALFTYSPETGLSLNLELGGPLQALQSCSPHSAEATALLHLGAGDLNPEPPACAASLLTHWAVSRSLEQHVSSREKTSGRFPRA